MIEHIGNCHGEWTFLLTALASIPFVGVWLRSIFKRRKCACGEEHKP
jgi:hypothetical protein